MLDPVRQDFQDIVLKMSPRSRSSLAVVGSQVSAVYAPQGALSPAEGQDITIELLGGHLPLVGGSSWDFPNVYVLNAYIDFL